MSAPKKKIGVLGLPEGWSTLRLIEAFESRGQEAPLIDPRALELDLARGTVWHQGLDLSSLDGLVVKKLGTSYSPHFLDRLEMLRFLAQGGLAIFSPPESMARMVDRLSCTVTLRLGQVPMPPTVVVQDVDAGLRALEHLGPSVLKPLYTSKARGMCLVRPGQEAAGQMREFLAEGHRFLYLQQMVDLTGQDLGLVFLGGRYIGAYARSARFAAEQEGGQPAKAKYLACHPDPAIIEMAARTQALFGLDFTCVDVAETAGGPVVFEVSAMGGFRGLQESQGVDAALLYADYVLGRLAQ